MNCSDTKTTHSGFALAILTILFFLAGCSTTPKELTRLDDASAIPRNAKIGITKFNNCGAGYQERHTDSADSHDEKIRFFKKCTTMGHPVVFSEQLRSRLEERLGKKLVTVKSAKPYKPKQVLRDAKQLKLDYIIAGDLLYLGESESKNVVESLFYVIRVQDARIILAGGVKKTGRRGDTLQLIDKMADELYFKAYTN